MKHSIGITIARFIMGFILFKDFVIYIANRETLFGEYAIMPLLNYNTWLYTYGAEYLMLPFENQLFLTVFLWLVLFVIVLFILGVKPLATSLVLLLLLTALRLRNAYILDGADNVIWVMLPFIALCPSYNLITNKVTNNLKHFKIAPYAMQFQFAIIYFFSGLSKVIEPIWYSGDALYYILQVEDFSPSRLNEWLVQNRFLTTIATYVTLIWELTFPIFIYFKSTRKKFLVIGVLLHLGIWVLMRIDNFSFVMLGMYFVFFENYDYKWIQNKIYTLFNRQSPHIVVT